MSHHPMSSVKRWAIAGILSFAASAGAASSAVTSDTPAPPAFVQDALTSASLSGKTQLRFLGLRIYDAQLWVGPQFQAEDFAAHPLALQLTYHRSFTGAAIAQRSLEEIERQTKLAPEQAQSWLKALTELLPDVQPGDQLTGVLQPGKGMRLWRDGKPLGTLNDPGLARHFFGIWLSPLTSEPGLRSALLANARGSTP